MDSEMVNPVSLPGSPVNESDFSCGVCLELLCKPVVLPCGHCFCFWCVSQAMSAFTASACPLCRQPYSQFPRPCLILGEIIPKLFPAAYQKRLDDIASERHLGSAPSLSDAATTVPTAAIQPRSVPSTTTTTTTTTTSSASHVFPSLGPMTFRSSTGTVIPYTWFGIGCDGCGTMPITGRRYRCTECPDAVGFDVCGTCYDAGLQTSGRYAQTHRAEHRMEECAQEITRLHLLQAQNPDMPLQQLLLWIDAMRRFQHEGDQHANDNDNEDDDSGTNSDEHDVT
eukprot:TRINITY_DN1042_c0_g1_i1.p1 TRINITY_DN1042_c0_g1~~TRINITY_DN1042_c0_g1_i1.p1  ORF type:complete len:283 (+),score=39.94 TRINITY_DN1042_c0_g1_i1:664-1512(+)